MIISKSFSTHDDAKRMIDAWAGLYLGSASGTQLRSERLAATAAMVARAIGQELAFLDAAENESPNPSQWPTTAGTPADKPAPGQKAA
jgi:hypothetical protein